MTRQQATKNINAQPVGRATLIVNDKCGDPSNYLYKINYLALHIPQVVRSLAIDITLADGDACQDQVRSLIDIYYKHERNR
jgi:hypothetical protein|tara:strand:+ start:575 stop:817 length:243 start_codon:yes stop_codon:yes gene_type:complete